MSEIGAIRNAIRAERQLIDAERAAVKMPPISTVMEPKKTNVVKTATGAQVDISRGYNVRTPDGLKIPFSSDTPLEKAKEWTKNFYRNDLETVPMSVTEDKGNKLESFAIRVKGDTSDKLQAQLHFSRLNGKDYTVHFSQIGEQYKGKGMGAGLYRQLFDLAKKDNSKVYSDTAMSQASVNVWLRFKQLGYPVIEHPRKRLMSGGYENAKSPSQPLFEFDPSKESRAPTKGVPDPVAEIDKNKPHLKVAGPQPTEVGDVDKEVRQALRGKTIGYDKRNEITNAWADYQLSDDPAEKEQLATKLRQLLPGTKE